eukprot:Sdes_comp19674_c0_seq1m11537
MVKYSLRIQASLENISNLKVCGEEFQWFLKLMCSNCKEMSPNWMSLSENESSEIHGSRGTTQLLLKCKFCSRESTIDIVPGSIKPYSDSGNWRDFVHFECRGVEPTEFEPRSGFVATGSESGYPFSDIEFTEGE